MTQHTTFTQSRQKSTGFLGLQVGLGSTPCQTRKEGGSWFIITGHRWFDQAVAQTLAAVKRTTTRPRLRPSGSQSNSRPVSTISGVYSILKWGDNHVQFCFYLFTMCCKKNEDVYALMVHLWTALTPVAHSPYVKPRQASCWKSRESRNYKCFLFKRIGGDKSPALKLTARVSPMFSWSAFLGGAKVANKEASLAPFYSCQGSFSPHGLCVTLDKRHKLCSVISKFTNCPHRWKPTSYPKSQPTVGIFPNDFFKDHFLNVKGQHPKILHQPETHKAVH